MVATVGINVFLLAAASLPFVAQAQTIDKGNQTVGMSS
jgi:hypothetical protein